MSTFRMNVLAATVSVLALMGAVSTANADVINNLSITTIPDPDVVPQSESAPCIICATNQAHNPAGFGYNNFDSTGNDSSFNLFSSNITGSFGNGDDVNVTPYTSGGLRSFLNANGTDPLFKFKVAIDINTTHANSEFLEFFQLIDLDNPLGSKIIFDIRNVALPGIHNGNGEADYLLSGFDLSNVNLGDRLLFRAQWSGAVDGGESFYIVRDTTAIDVPEPASIAVLGSGLAFAGVLGWRRRRNNSVVA